MKTLCCFLEENSARYMLEGVLPRIIPSDVSVTYVIFEGKQDLEKQVERKMKFWLQPNTVFLVMRDKDSGDCVAIKKGLVEKVNRSGKLSRSIIRIACAELESFYLGDLLAVENGLNVPNLARRQNERKFRNPDERTNASEELSKLTNGSYQKIAGSRAISPHLKIDGSSCSHSFNILISGLNQLLLKLDS